ncbi:MAG: DUF2848 family protein [Alphaproteobacteria bacterium]
MMQQLVFDIPGLGPATLDLRRVLAAGYTGRDRALVDAHIHELEEIGVAPPKHVPMLFPLAPSLVTTADEIAPLGFDSTPEIEFVLFRTLGFDYVTVGSDHTDRKVEAQSVVLSKNLCPKPIAKAAWPVSAVRAHWDRLVLKSTCDGETLQEGPLSMIMDPGALMAFVDRHDGDAAEGRMIFSGTVPTTRQPPRDGGTIELTLSDPVLNRRLLHRYTVSPMREIFPE